MRAAAVWVFACLVWTGELGGSAAMAQDLVPEEEDMEARGEPPVTPPPPAVGMPDPGAGSVLDAPPTAPDPYLDANARLLQELLVRSSEETIREQKFAAAAGITGGMILLGLGAWRLIENEPQNQFTRGLGVMFTTLGASDLTTGVFAATRVPHEKRRLDRWQKMLGDGLSEVELARMEGELLAASETRNGERMLVRWNGLTHALAGVIVLGFAPIPDNSQSDRVSGYVIGAVFIGTGMAAFGLSFRPTPSEKAWNEYEQKRKPSSGSQVSLRMSPAVSRTSIGVGLSGTF